MTRALSRNPGIDLLRGLSIVLVVMNHVGLRIPLQRTGLAAWLPTWWLKALIYNGLPAVYIFFVISGFLITSNMVRRWGTLGAVSLRAFYVRRFARIVPLLVLLVAVLSMLHLAGLPYYVIHRQGQSLGGAIASAFGLYLNWYEARTGYLPGNWDVLWSLSIEEVFYIGFPLACLLLRRLRYMVPLLVLLALSLPITRSMASGDDIWLEKAYLPGMAAIACGILAALLAAQVRMSRMAGTWMTWGGSGGLLLLLLRGDLVWPCLGQGVMLAVTVATAILVLGLHLRRQTAGRDFHVWRGLAWLTRGGRLSYEVYLTHMFVVFAAVGLYRQLGSPLVTGYLWYPVIVIVAIALGELVARHVSQPVERELRKRWLTERP